MFVDVKKEIDIERIMKRRTICGYWDYITSSKLGINFHPLGNYLNIFWNHNLGRIYEKNGEWFWELEFSEDGCRVY